MSTDVCTARKEIEGARDYNLDLLKILACLAILGMHTLHGNGADVNLLLCLACTFAIPVFFASSGAVLLQRESITVKYCVRKIIGLLRVSIAWSVLVESCVVLAKLLLNISLDRMPIVSEIKNMTYRPLIQGGYMWQFWYLGAMVIVYCILPCLHKLVHANEKRWRRIWIALILICLSVQLASYYLGRPVQRGIIQTFRVWTWIQYFIAGGGMIYICNKLSKHLTIKIHFILTLLWTIFITFFQFYLAENVIFDTHPEYYYDDLLVVVWVVLMMSFVLRVQVRGKLRKAVEILSGLTMGVYIIHPLINNICLRFLEFNTAFSAVMYYIFVTIISFSVTHLFSKLPFSKYMLRI